MKKMEQNLNIKSYYKVKIKLTKEQSNNKTNVQMNK